MRHRWHHGLTVHDRPEPKPQVKGAYQEFSGALEAWRAAVSATMAEAKASNQLLPVEEEWNRYWMAEAATDPSVQNQGIVLRVGHMIHWFRPCDDEGCTEEVRDAS